MGWPASHVLLGDGRSSTLLAHLLRALAHHGHRDVIARRPEAPFICDILNRVDLNEKRKKSDQLLTQDGSMLNS